MSKNNIQVTPEAIEDAYKVLGISLFKAEDDEMNKEDDKKPEEDEGEDSPEDKKEDKKEKEKKKKVPEKMEKSEDSALEAINRLSKSLEGKFEALATINKSLTDSLSETREELEKAQEKLEAIETSPMSRKSVTTSNFIEKAFQENETSGKKMLSMSQHKSSIQRLLIEKAGLDGDTFEKSAVNDFWSNEMQYFEATNSLHPKAIEKLFKEDNIQLVK
jgi:hypothetical protein